MRARGGSQCLVCADDTSAAEAIYRSDPGHMAPLRETARWADDTCLKAQVIMRTSPDLASANATALVAERRRGKGCGLSGKALARRLEAEPHEGGLVSTVLVVLGDDHQTLGRREAGLDRVDLDRNID